MSDNIFMVQPLWFGEKNATKQNYTTGIKTGIFLYNNNLNNNNNNFNVIFNDFGQWKLVAQTFGVVDLTLSVQNQVNAFF